MEQARSRSLQNLCFICTLYFEIGCLMYLILKIISVFPLRLLQAIAMMAAGLFIILIYLSNASLQLILNCALSKALHLPTRTAHT